MHAVHAGYTVLAPIVPERLDDLRATLAGLDAGRFERVSSVHFASMAIIPAMHWEDEELPAHLLIATSFAGPARAHLRELIRACGDLLRAALAHCDGLRHPCDDAELAFYLWRHRVPDTFYSGMHDLTREDVVMHDRLRAEIQRFVDASDFTGLEAEEIHRAIRAHMDTLDWVKPWRPPRYAWLVKHWRLAALGAVVVPWLATMLVSTLGFVLFGGKTLGLIASITWLGVVLALLVLAGLVTGIFHSEEEQTYVAQPSPFEHVRALHATQNHPVINEMTIAGPVKEGGARPLTLRIAMWIIARVAEGVPRLKPHGITIPTVATARWIAADRGRRLIFISNFTNPSEPYVRDFIDDREGAMNINLSFGFGRGYPKTRWIVFDGALTDPNAFIHAVNANQRPTELWYCPYRHLSIDNIKRNRRIALGLHQDLDRKAAQDWLHEL